MTPKNICVLTGSRSEYGLLYWLLREIKNDPETSLQLIVTGMHLSPEFGETYEQIEQDGFSIDRKIDILLSSDTSAAMSKSIGLGCINMVDALQDLQSDMLVLLGDRFEMLAGCIAAVSINIPVAHIHGGEISRGAVDDSFRHAITKMASLHFPATEQAKQRILQMGEPQSRVYQSGSPGLDELYKTDLYDRETVFQKLDLSEDHDRSHALVLFHPMTRDRNTPKEQIDPLLTALEQTNIQLVLLQSNADPAGRIFNQKLQLYADKHAETTRLIPNLKRKLFLSAMKHFDLLIGNSSSGITEAPSFQLPVVNIGKRQDGRVKADNVLDCENSVESIQNAIEKAQSSTFQQQLSQIRNPYDQYGDGQTSKRIKDLLKETDISDNLLQKQFVDLPPEASP